MMSTCTELLGRMIGFDTQNPTGDDLALCRYLGDELKRRGADAVDIASVPRGDNPTAYVHARFGNPELLINVHVDTVPANTGWSYPALEATRTSDRVYGLGSADTKGAIAAVLCALEATNNNQVGILFSGDEERGTAAMHAFLAAGHGSPYKRAIVCEPTGRRVGIRHRGVAAFDAFMPGKGGHSSQVDEHPKPIVDLAKLAIALDELASTHADIGPSDMKGLCMNVAGIRGGVAFNVIPDSATLTASFRAPPGFDCAPLWRDINAASSVANPTIEVRTLLDHIAFATRDESLFRQLVGDHTHDFVGLQFWTEAALLSAAGIDAIVVGPGDIEQAHAADEFVSLADLEWAIKLFTHVLSQ